MHVGWSYFFVLLWLTYMIASGVLLFSRGFLLSRVSKTDINSCRRLSTNPEDEYFITEEMVQEIFKDVNATSNLCLPQKSKVIILVIDALKYEFGIYKENLTNPLPFENKLKILHELLEDKPEHARMLRFKADPPTTTLQRLKGLTTGSLPTFIDIGSNFASPEINEDNIIDQMTKYGLPVVMLGDSTWTDLYPRRFMRSYAYPSFDIFDLDTVDSEIEKYLPKELNKNDWQVLIAHFLGVDHCGHKHGPLHEEMARKLTEMNNVIKSVVDKMDNETTLFIMGDHGMTASGDHGGESEDETNALLFAYSKGNKFVNGDFGSDNTTMQQIDLVPTLATILGIPIPYSNLGLVNFNIVPDVNVPYMSKFETLLLHAWQNAQQIYSYFYNYALENKRTFNVEEMDKMETNYILLSHRVKTIYNEMAYKSFIGDLNIHLRQILSTCREIWVKFDSTQMSQGLLMTILPIFFSFLLINNSRSYDFHLIFPPREVAYTYMLNFAVAIFGYRYHRQFAFKSEEHAIIFFTNILSTFVLVFQTIQNWPKIAINWSNTKRFVSMPTRVILIVLMSVFFSNSFIIQEPKILSYLLVAAIMLLAYEVLQKGVRIDNRTRFRISQFLRSSAFPLLLISVLAVILVRFAYTLFRCREEQGNCADFSNNYAGFSLKQSINGKIFLFAALLIVLYTTVAHVYLHKFGNLMGYSPSVLLARYGPTIATICVGGHMLLANSGIKHIERSHIDAMALIIYALLALQIIVITVSPLMVYALPKPQLVPTHRQEDIVSKIFKKMKTIYKQQNRLEKPIYGLAMVYSSVIIIFGVFLAMVLIVLLGPKSSIGFLICIVVGAILLPMHAVLRYRTATNFETCIQPTFTAIVSWFLLAHFCFFATSHQTTLSQIDWRAAFVGRTSSIGQSTFISGVLVMLNTFCGQVFFFSMYALLCTHTFQIFLLFPTLIGSHCNRDNRRLEPDLLIGMTTPRSYSDVSIECIGFDMMRGEVLLYEHQFAFLATAFKVAVQLLLLQGIKVFCAMLACTIHCRHLMVWKIFAPRFIYEALATFIGLPALAVGYLLILRTHIALEKLVARHQKMQ